MWLKLVIRGSPMTLLLLVTAEANDLRPADSVWRDRRYEEILRLRAQKDKRVREKVHKA
jgi:hypothetical protein